MLTIQLDLPDQLAKRVLPLQDSLPEIIEIGLRHWHKQILSAPHARVEQLWEAAGLVEPVSLTDDYRPVQARERRTRIQAGGQPASEIIIEQRGAL